MNLSRLLFAIVAGCCLLGPSPLRAVDNPPFEMEKHYSADVVITTKDRTINSKAYVDGDKTRSDVAGQGMDISIIMRKDKGKVYNVMASQKIAMELPIDPNKLDERANAALGPEGKFDLIGPDTIGGVACTKFKVTPSNSKGVFFFWIDVAKKLPVQMTDDSGTFKVQWKNFVAGPQDPSLFEIPAGFTIMPMPNMNQPGQP